MIGGIELLQPFVTRILIHSLEEYYALVRGGDDMPQAGQVDTAFHDPKPFVTHMPPA